MALSVLRIIKADDDRKKQFSLILACLHGAAGKPSNSEQIELLLCLLHNIMLMLIVHNLS